MAGAAFSGIPVVDFSEVRDRMAPPGDLVDDVRQICHEIGFFVVTNHGVAPQLVDDVFLAMHQFFALPDATKALIDKRQSPHFRGWEAEGAEQTNNQPDIRQQIDLWSEWPPAPADDAGTPRYQALLGPNQWLPEDVLPGHKPLMYQWFTELGALADQILGVLSLGLGLDQQHLLRLFGEQPMSLTKLISYPPSPPGQAGVNAHHDTGFVTVLAPGPTPGLQVQNPDGDWIDVASVQDGFVINLGEMLQAMTGNYFVATPHRVITDAPRISAAYFHGPSLDAPLDPLPLDPSFAAVVAASPRHSSAGFMAGRDETDAGVAAMQSRYRASTYGQQLWNYFARSYPANMERHYGSSRM